MNNVYAKSLALDEVKQVVEPNHITDLELSDLSKEELAEYSKDYIHPDEIKSLVFRNFGEPE